MRCALPILLLLTTLPLAAWEPLQQNALAAVKGSDLQLSLLNAGLPLPPTRSEARSAAGYRYGLERQAIKRCLVYRTSLAKSARNRYSPELNRATAELARHTGAPALFAQYLELMAGRGLSRRQEYELNRALRYLVQETYGVDMLQIRLVSESLDLTSGEHTLYMLQLPVAGVFELSPQGLPARSQLLPDIRTLTTVMRRCGEILRKVHDRASADAAAARLQELLPLWGSAQHTRLHAGKMLDSFSAAEKLAVQLLDTTAMGLLEERRRLHEQNWYGSTRLRTIDELLR